jgi:hypothetical protein
MIAPPGRGRAGRASFELKANKAERVTEANLEKGLTSALGREERKPILVLW